MYDYIQLKKKKLIKLETDGEGYFLSITKFDVNTGEKKVPACISLARANLEKIKMNLEKKTADITEILKDMKLLEGRKK